MARKSVAVDDPDSGQTTDLTLLVARGAADGPTTALVSGQEGTALNGSAAIHLLFRHLDVAELKGTIVAVPLTNPAAARIRREAFPTNAPAGSPGVNDMTGAWPGDPAGSLAQRTAATLWEHCIESCHAVVDFHAQAVQYGPMTVVRATSDSSVATAKAFGVAHIRLTRHKEAPQLCDIAARQGKAALEVHLPPRRLIHPPSVRLALNGTRSVMAHLQMLEREVRPAETALIIPEAEEHVRTAPTDGIVLAHVDPGSIAQEGKLVAEIISIHDFEVADQAVAPFRGVVTMIGCPSRTTDAFDHDLATRGASYARMVRCDL